MTLEQQVASTNQSKRQLISRTGTKPAPKSHLAEQTIFLSRLSDAILHLPPLLHVRVSSSFGPPIYGLLATASRFGLQALFPAAPPLRAAVQIKIERCRPVLGEVVSSVRRSSLYQTEIALSSLHRPEISVGDLATVETIGEPIASTRGSVFDAENARLSMLCKTTLVPGLWVCVHANDSILFGVVEAVVARSMVASRVDIHFGAAFPAALTEPSRLYEQGLYEQDRYDQGRNIVRDEALTLGSSRANSGHEGSLFCA